jgi:regulator of protease activity HflC (stomatin/prohibitin superfamily)
VPLTKDASSIEFDVIVDEASSSPNQKEAVWAMLQQMMPLLAKLPVPPAIWAKLIKYSPLPDSLGSEISQMILQQAQQPPPPDPRVMAAQQMAQIKGQQAQQQAALSAQQAQQDAALQQQQAQQDMAMRAAEMQQEMLLERQKAQQEMAIDGARAGMDMKIAQYKADQDAQNAREIAKARATQMKKAPKGD